ncbi:Ig-like domain-containing protein [uncultured Parabacteroides sp.]|jgi:uncharacterized protein YjdB|uniref:Ig-like domain-containing protein n=1 Tax=uncultured Parabacteroides sp. TaxID=512312 RepID=UPI0025EB9C93|nr:Ig-like domain-containing protein [uncultured Parabacteroides sp.]
MKRKLQICLFALLAIVGMGWALTPTENTVKIESELSATKPDVPVIYGITTTKGNAGDQNVQVKFEVISVEGIDLANSGFEYYEVKSQKWIKAQLEAGQSFVFGTSEGFPLQDATSYFKVTPKGTGTMVSKMEVINVTDKKVIASKQDQLEVTNDALNISVTKNEETVYYGSLYTAVLFAEANDVIQIPAGTYDLKRGTESIQDPEFAETDGKWTGWYLPIQKKLTIQGAGKGETILMSSTEALNNKDDNNQQDFITVFPNASGTVIKDMTIISKSEANKAIHVFGKDFTMSDVELRPAEDANHFAGSIYFHSGENNGTIGLTNVDLNQGRISFSGTTKANVTLESVMIDYTDVSIAENVISTDNLQDYPPIGSVAGKDNLKITAKNVSVSLAANENRYQPDATTFNNLPVGTKAVFTGGTYTFAENLIIGQSLVLEGTSDAKLQFTRGGLVVNANDVKLNNLNVETQAGAPVTINANKTGTVVDKGHYSYNTLNNGETNAQGQSAIRFLGSNGNVNVSDVTANGIFVDACNGTLTGIKGNTIGFDYEGPVSWAGINIKFSGDNSNCADIEIEALVGQNKITMPAKGAQYQALYQKSDWTALAGLATAGTADVLIALATDGKNNIRVNLANDLVLTTPALFTQTGMTLDGKGKTISVSDDFAGGDYPIILGNNNSSQTGTFNVKDLTLDSRNKVKGLDIYQMEEVTLDKVTLKNSKGAGLVVNGSKVTASALVTESNEWGGVNVGPGSNVTSDCALTLLGSDNDLKEEAPIYVDAKDFALIDAAEGQKIVITSPGYIMGEKESGKTTVWTKFVVPEGGIASEDALKEAVENNQKEIVLKPAEGGAESPIELNETLTVKAEMTIKSEDPETPVVISVPAGTSAFATGEGGNLTLENVVVKTVESQSTNTAPVISVIAGTEATLQNSKLEVPASVTAIKAEGQMTLSNVEMTVTDITAGTEAPVINVTSGGDVTIDNAAITNGTIEVTGKLTVTPAENAEVVFTQSGDKPAIDLKDGATVTISEAQFSGKAVTAASGATIKLFNCNFSSPIESKAMMMTKATANDATVVNAGDATAEIECCIFTGITGTNPMIYGKNLTIKNCLFYDNADMVMIDIAASGNSVIANNTCVNNNTDAKSAVINIASTPTSLSVKNNILWTNATEAITGTATGISHNALKTATTVEANSLKLPTFAYIQFNHTNRKYQLHADSPVAKAHGDITGIADDATDLLGNARLTSDGTNKTVHLGAYESVYTPSSGGGSTGGSGDETPSATGIKLDKTTLALHRLESYTLKATVEPSNAGGVKWTSTDPSVVTVDANGKVTAVKVGEATIIATAINGGLTALCQVTVDFATGVEEALAETVVYGREGYIQIQPATPIQILVVNMTGVAVANRTVSQTETISVPKGIYIVRMSSGGHVVTQKVNVR